MSALLKRAGSKVAINFEKKSNFKCYPFGIIVLIYRDDDNRDYYGKKQKRC